MATVVRRHLVDEAGRQALLAPRVDALRREVPEAPAPGREPAARFGADDGPFRSYERTVAVAPAGPRAEGHWACTERIRFRLAIPYFGILFVPFARRALLRTHDTAPWWAPPDRIDRRTGTVLGLLAGASILVGYQNTLITQSIAFAAEEFGAGEVAQGTVLAVTRAGVLLSLVLATLADRRGRRAVVVGCAFAGPVLAATGAFVPSLGWLGASQVLARPVALALGIAVGIVAAEEVPRDTRAYALSMLALATAFGAALCVLALPVADLGERAWRVLYLLPLAGLAIAVDLHRRLPESRRFARPHGPARLAGHGRRLWMLAVTGFAVNVFVAPATGFQNRYLRVERGFSATAISAFTVVTGTPAGLGVLAGGAVADRRGRRVVAAVALAGGSAALAGAYLVSGVPLWALSIVGSVLAAAGVPALGVYGPELFPTGVRGKANGILGAVAVAGSALGLMVAGAMAETAGRYGGAMVLLALGPVAMAGLVLAAYPETAHQRLEDINPEDRLRRDLPDGQRPE